MKKRPYVDGIIVFSLCKNIMAFIKEKLFYLP